MDTIHDSNSNLQADPPSVIAKHVQNIRDRLTESEKAAIVKFLQSMLQADIGTVQVTPLTLAQIIAALS